MRMTPLLESVALTALPFLVGVEVGYSMRSISRFRDVREDSGRLQAAAANSTFLGLEYCRVRSTGKIKIFQQPVACRGPPSPPSSWL